METVVQLLGSPRVGSEPLPADRRGCLLAVLACDGTWVSRDRLALLFWPDSDEGSARRNLRQLLSRVRRLGLASELEMEPSRLRWPVPTDVALFRQALARGDDAAAVALYRGELLAGFPVQEAGGFEAWLELEREGLARAFRRAALQDARAAEREGRFDAAAERLERLLAGDPLAEDVLRQLLRVLYLAGRREAALAAFERFARLLLEELGLEPLEATRELVATIRAAVPPEDLRSATSAARPTAEVPLSVLRPARVVGREASVAAVRRSSAPVVLLTGEAGIGKSRLLAELAPHAWAARCQEGLRSVPYHPIAALVRDLLRTGEGARDASPLRMRLLEPRLGHYLEDLARLVPEIAPTLAPGPAEPQTAKVRLLEALARLFEALADGAPEGAGEGAPAAPPGAPFVLALDDLQWADDATLELLGFLGARRSARVLGAYRADEAPGPLREVLRGLRSARAVDVVELAPLGEDEVRELLAELIGGGSGPPLFGRWLRGATGGNPMFALETLKSMFESGVLRADREGWHTGVDEVTLDYGELEVPSAISEVVARRVGRLSAEAARVLQAAAVVREGFGPALLGQVAGLSEWAVMEALEEAEGSGLVEGDRFRHDLLRHSIYRSLADGRRRLLHARVAEALDPSADPIVVAEHWLEAGDPERAGARWRRAAERLRDRGMHDEAIALLERALRHVDDPAASWALQAELADTYRRVARHERAERIVEALLEACEDPRLRASAFETRAANHLKQGRIELALQAVEEGLRLSGGADDGRLERKLVLLKAQVELYRGRPEAALPLLEPFLARIPSEPDGVEACTLLVSVAGAYDQLGEHERALPLHLEALALATRLGAKHLRVDAALNLLYCAMDLGRAEEGIAPAEEALALGRFEGTDILRSNLAAALCELGRDVEAVAHYEALARECEDPTLLSIAHARLAELHARAGRRPEARAALQRALEVVARTEFGIARARVAVAAYRLGSEAQARAAALLADAVDGEALPPYLREELDRARRAEAPLLRHLLQGDLAAFRVEASDLEAARGIADALLAETADPALRARALLAKAAHALFRASEVDEAARLVEQAGALARGIDDVALRQRVWVEEVALCYFRGEYERGLERCREALPALRAAPPGDTLFRALHAAGECLHALGRYGEALEHHLDSLEVARRLGARHLQVYAAMDLLICYRELGRPEEAIALAEEALALGHYLGSNWLRNNLAVSYLRLGRLEEALEHSRHLIRDGDPNFLPLCHARVAEIHHLQGRAAAVEPALEEALARLDGTRVPAVHALALATVLRHGSPALRRRAARLARSLDLDAVPRHAREGIERALDAI